MDLFLKVLEPITQPFKFHSVYELTITRDGKDAKIQFMSDSMRKTVRDIINSSARELFSKELTTQEMDEVFDFIGNHELVISESIKSIENTRDLKQGTNELTEFEIIFLDYSFDDSYVVIQYKTSYGSSGSKKFICSLFHRSPGDLLDIIARSIFGYDRMNHYLSKNTYESFKKLLHRFINDDRFHYHLVMSYNNMTNRDKFKKLYQISIVKS